MVVSSVVYWAEQKVALLVETKAVYSDGCLVVEKAERSVEYWVHTMVVHWAERMVACSVVQLVEHSVE